MTRRQQVADGALAAAVGIGCTLEVWAPNVFGSTHMNGPRVAVFGAYLVAVCALAFRRRWPLGCALVVSVALTSEWLVFGSPEGFGVFAIPLIASYSVAAHEDRKRALAGLGALAVTGFVWTWRDPVDTTLREHIQSSVWLSPILIAWLLGAYLRTRRLYVAELHERADRAEREREERAAAAVSSERSRIARELHDIVAHSVSVMVVHAEAADEMLERLRPDRARSSVWTIQETGRAALTDMRRMLGILREADSTPALTPQPGIANLELLLVQVRESGLPVELAVVGVPRPLPPGVDLSAYRIVQEALTNSLKYAGRARARVAVRYAPGVLELEVSDDGVGTANGAAGGHGLVGMRERVTLFGGELDAGPAPGGGYIVRARLPLRGEV